MLAMTPDFNYKANSNIIEKRPPEPALKSSLSSLGSFRPKIHFYYVIIIIYDPAFFLLVKLLPLLKVSANNFI